MSNEGGTHCFFSPFFSASVEDWACLPPPIVPAPAPGEPCAPAASGCCRPGVRWGLCPGQLLRRGLAGGCRRWTCRNRNNGKRGRQVCKVIGDGRTGWYKEGEAESWKQFWMMHCSYPWHRQSLEQCCSLCSTSRVMWCALWAASTAFQGSGVSVGTSPLGLWLILFLAGDFTTCIVWVGQQAGCLSFWVLLDRGTSPYSKCRQGSLDTIPDWTSAGHPQGFESCSRVCPGSKISETFCTCRHWPTGSRHRVRGPSGSGRSCR